MSSSRSHTTSSLKGRATPYHDIHTNTTSNTTTLQYTNTSDPLVQYDLECRADDIFCDKVSRAVGAAIDFVSQVINVKNSLLIKVRYYSFCEHRCANETYGWGSPTSQFTLPFEDGADLNYVYPQALAKQLAPYSSTSVWAKYDIEIEINHDAYMNSTDLDEAYNMYDWNGTGTPPGGVYWFYASGKNAIKRNQVDFRYIVLHELLHGLGFLSSWAAYFWTDASPFRTLVDGIIDASELQVVTPGPYWFINQDTGPAYVTGFQPNMIFDKYLISVVNNDDDDDDSSSNNNKNGTQTFNLSEVAFEMQDFCVQNSNAFIVNFIKLFNSAKQSTTAHQLWHSLSEPETLSFEFQPPAIANSSYNLIPYLNQTYHKMTLLTGPDLFERSRYEFTGPTLNRPGLAISHLDDQYARTPDFLMTRQYHMGHTLEELVAMFYKDIPELNTSATTPSLLLVEKTYRSPIGPGILRILDSIGYSTVLTKTNYTTGGSVKTPKSRSLCDDSNTSHGLKSSPTPMSSSATRIIASMGPFIYSIFFLLSFLFLFTLC
ncbi:hypothetical protein BDF20DRAFT_816775 [Mycotypha africana]|uniref:uncharacterized protein n=1 Tax=Mycotypha africana TaxID=64632 RepID=UPI002300C4EE|nr:uncharacterized protein BDF20DRAFT_816775 [Mycotypha africana]KAI8984551.1 hypothetical protein BDF20DRAFT_816775 [Mycotypha africana]